MVSIIYFQLLLHKMRTIMIRVVIMVIMMLIMIVVIMVT